VCNEGALHGLSLALAIVAAVRQDMSNMFFVAGMVLMCAPPQLWLVVSPLAVYIAILVGMVCALLAVLLLQRAP
jgi:hypothetical protein